MGDVLSVVTAVPLHKQPQTRCKQMSRAEFQPNFIYGQGNLNFISFSHVMKYYSSFDIFPPTISKWKNHSFLAGCAKTGGQPDGGWCLLTPAPEHC